MKSSLKDSSLERVIDPISFSPFVVLRLVQSLLSFKRRKVSFLDSKNCYSFEKASFILHFFEVLLFAYSFYPPTTRQIGSRIRIVRLCHTHNCRQKVSID